MYKRIDVNKVRGKLYESHAVDNKSLLKKFSKMSNLIKLKDPESFRNAGLSIHSDNVYRYHALHCTYSNQWVTGLRTDYIQNYIKRHNIVLDDDRYLLCIPESFVNFVLSEKYKNIETHYKKQFLYERKLDVDHVLNDMEYVYLFLNILKDHNITGAVYFYNADKQWAVPILSNEGEKIFGLGRSVESINTTDYVKSIDMRSAQGLDRPELFNALTDTEFTPNDVLHLYHVCRFYNICSVIKNITSKSIFINNEKKHSEKTLDNIKTTIIGSMYD